MSEWISVEGSTVILDSWMFEFKSTTVEASSPPKLVSGSLFDRIQSGEILNIKAPGA